MNDLLGVGLSHTPGKALRQVSQSIKIIIQAGA